MDKEEDIVRQAVALLRLQKHDIVNVLQVVMGYLQLNKKDEALKYILDANINFRRIGTIMTIVYPRVVLQILSSSHEVFRLGIPVTLESKSDLKILTCEEVPLAAMLKKAWQTCTMAQLKLPSDNRWLEFTIDESGSFIFIAPNLAEYIDPADFMEIETLVGPLNFEVLMKGEKLIIRNNTL
ncbi:MAG: Spo0B domain-containing protein [Bacillota bacterium]